MQNKKTAIILVFAALVLFILVSFVFMYEPAKNKFLGDNNKAIKPEEVTGDLPVLKCDYGNDQAAYSDAITKKDVNLCDCIDENDFKSRCKSASMDVAFYNQAFEQLNTALCEKINSEIQKDSCYKVVQSSIEEFEKKDPQQLANIYTATHNENAIAAYEKLTETDRGNIENYLNLALSYAEKGLKEQERGNDQMLYVEKAFESIKSAKVIDDKNAEVYRIEAYINEIKPDYAQAAILYDKAIELDENNILAYAGRGHVRRMMGMLEAAVEDFNMAAKLDVNNAHVFIYTNLCNLEHSRSHNEDAIKNCKTVTQAEFADPVFQSEAYQIMAIIFIGNNDLIQAKNYLLQAKTLTPSDPNLYVKLSKLNVFEALYTEAENNANKAIELSPTKAVSYLALSHAFYMQEKFNESIVAAEKGIFLIESDVSLLAPSKPSIERDLNYAIANCYRQMGDVTKQLEYEERGKKAFEE